MGKLHIGFSVLWWLIDQIFIDTLRQAHMSKPGCLRLSVVLGQVSGFSLKQLKDIDHVGRPSISIFLLNVSMRLSSVIT